MEERNWLRQLCDAIQMPREVTEILLASPIPQLRFSPDLPPETWADRITTLQEALRPDDRGLKLLTVLLLSCQEVWERYQALGMDWPLFTATMACFSRFVREHRDSFGCWGFDREWWVPRQLTCRLFRIGLLEYELTEEQGQRVVSLHIPSGAKLEPAALRSSWLRARALIDRRFPLWKDAPMVCRSWLLSPALKQMLPAGSRILYFQSCFTITPLPQNGKGYLLWVFRRTDLPLEQLPQETTLQRNLKAYLLAGNEFPDARGVLCADPFLPILEEGEIAL